MMGETILVAEDIFRDYGCLHALNGINLRVEKGEFIAIIGPNGAGKSTLLKILASLSSPTKGTLHIFGTKDKDREDVQDRIGMLSHETFLYDNLTARENLLFLGNCMAWNLLLLMRDVIILSGKSVCGKGPKILLKFSQEE
ncbi:ATP-binding cassette domain-containing protein [Methanohalophilus profundi]|uniref:ATP-binding cassette domain-containing protein n=1 Tax=Methanohalophilus profundi TaxID=2138083 RepID=UPI00101D750C|nr:ATP-binding cassette domain-containing protein [Methanohalophilus profundi]